MMPMGMHGMPYGQMGMMGMGGPMMGHPMMGNGPPMMHMGMGGPMGMGMMQVVAQPPTLIYSKFCRPCILNYGSPLLG